MDLSRAVFAAPTTSAARRTWGLLLSTLLAATALVVAPATAAHATGSSGSSSPNFVCTPKTVYTIDSTGTTIRKLDPTTGSSSKNGSFQSASDDDDSSADRINALALPGGGGRYAYAFNRDQNKVLRFDATTNKVNAFNVPSNSSAGSVVAGAINPATGIYYYASGGNPWKLFAFNTNTSSGIGQVGTISGLSSNGDMAFDAAGNLYVVSNPSSSGTGTLARVTGPLPTTAGSTSFSSTTLATLPGDSGQYASTAFDASGELVIGTTDGKLLRVNPTSGATIGTKTISLSMADMASCASPSTAAAKVNLPEGRFATGDQFKVTVGGGGITTGNTGTTAGNDNGVQNEPDEVAGPVLVMPGGSYSITQTGANGANLDNYATTWRCVTEPAGTQIASGNGSSGTFTVPSGSGGGVVCTFTNVPQRPAIELDKTGSAIADLDGNGPDAGDKITYSFKVTNTGNVPLNPVTVTDTKVGGVTCPSGALAPGGSVSCSNKDYTITQAEVNAGKVDNTATAEGTPPAGRKVTDDDSVSTPVPSSPAIELVKSAGAINDTDGNGVDAGDTITYTFKVTNKGNVPLNPVTVSDPKVGPITCPTGALAPGADVTCSPKTYTLTQADVNNGKVDNTATAEGTPPSGPKVSDPDTVSTPVPVLPAIELKKTAGAIQDKDGNGPDAGDEITYTFKVTNKGNVPLNPVTVSDPKVGAVTCPSGALAPGASVTCSPKTYTLTQADVNNGKVVNTATAEGTPPSGPKVTDDDSTTTVIGSAPAIELVKTASAIQDLDGNGPDAGDKITYSFKVTNIGTVTLSNITVTDTKVGAVTCPSGNLAPGASVSCSDKSYTITQAEVTAGKVDNTATAEGTPPSGPKVSDDDSVTTTVPSMPAIELVKTAGAIQDKDGNGPDAGDEITYTFKVTNKGNVPLNPVTVSDPKVGAVTCPSGALAPGASVTCSPATYTLTQADVNNGKVDNTATAEGTPPTGPKVSDPDSVSTPVPSMPAVELVKKAGDVDDKDGNGIDAGDTITYTFKVTNTGNVPLNPVTVSDPKVGAVTCPSGPLAPGASVDCSPKTYTITQADMNAGTVDNTATVQGTPPSGPKVTDDDSTTTTLDAGPAIKLVKTGSAINDVNGNGNDAGDTITYSFEVTNTGNVTLTGITVSDPKVGAVTCPTAPLAPGASVDCSPRIYTITQDDVDAGRVDNTATATGTAPDGEVVEDDDSYTVNLPATPSIAIDKNAGALNDVDGNGPDAGDTITYSFSVYNTGALVLKNIAVSDPKAGPVTCPETELAPTESMVCDDVVYTVTAADVAAGKVDNTATVTGTPPSGPKVTDEDSTSTPIQQTTTNIKVVKDVDNANPRVGDTITYTITVTVTGSAAAKDVVITDHLPSGVTFVSAEAPCTRSGSTVTCALGTLPAGGSESIDIRVKVDPLPAVNTDHQHWIDVQKTEVHVDVDPGQTATGTTTCMPGYSVTDGSGRIDHVDQGTGTFSDIAMTESRAVGTNAWKATFVSSATGRAQAKVFSVCTKDESELVNGHHHGPVFGDQLTETTPLPSGESTVTLTCAPGKRAVQPGYVLDGVATVRTSYPVGVEGWTWVVDNGSATSGTFSMRCLDPVVSNASGHTHGLKFSEIRQTGTVPAGQSKEFTLTCADDAKGIVAGYDMDPGLVNQGNDPRPIIRVFKFYNPTNGPLDVRLFLLCLGNRTGGGADGGGTITNTASATTSSPETTTADNSDTAKITVDTSAPATITSPTVVATPKVVTTAVSCKNGKEGCSGVATLVALKSQKVAGKVIKKGTVLAKAKYKVKSGKKATIKLKTTKAGKKALRSVKKAKLTVGGKAKTVKIRR